MTEFKRPLPHTNEPLTAEYWQATNNGELKIRKCQSCGSLQFPPREMCIHCHTQDFDWITVSGNAKLFTLSPSITPSFPAFKDDAPYTIVIVELEEGPRMLGWAANIEADQLEIGMPMQPVFRKVNDDVTLVDWEPAAT